MITLGGVQLPDGLIWEDEHGWDAVEQSAEYTLTGSLVVEEAQRQAGRPITLRGGRQWAWVTRDQVTALQAVLAPVDAEATLQLHDGRMFSVIPRRDGNGPVEVAQVPAVGETGVADPAGGTKYYLERLRLMES